MKKLRVSLILLTLVTSALAGTASTTNEHLTWSKLPQIPPPAGRDEQIGLAGMYAGVHNDVLIVAGGANFADGPNWEDGKKLWYDEIFVLEKVSGDDADGQPEATMEDVAVADGPRYKWTRANTHLPVAIGYGASISTPKGVVCIGGHDEADDRGKQYADVFRMAWNPDARKIEIETLPPLPRVSTMWCAGMIDQVIYVAGYTKLEDDQPQKHFWALDLAAADEPNGTLSWMTLDPWSGPPLTKATSGVQDGKFYLFGGDKPAPDKDGKPATEPSLVVYRFQSAKRAIDGTFQEGEWKRMGDLPRPVVVPPSPAQPTGQSHLLVFSGWDGTPYDGEISKHPGFSSEVLAYHTITDTWRTFESIPRGVVTGPATKWGDMILIVSGEMRPCVRNPDIMVARLSPVKGSFGAINWAVLIAYLAVLVWIGFYFSARENSTEDFFLAGRRIPPWAAGFSMFATLLSAITFMAAPAKAFTSDWTFWFMGIIGLPGLLLVIYLLVPFFRRLNLSTAYEYLERRFNLAVRWIGSFLFIAFQLGRMAVVLYLPALALSAVTGMDTYVCIIIMGVLSTFYTVLGGVEAVIWSDVLQGVVLMGAALLSVILIVNSIDGGLGHVLSTAYADGKLRIVHMTWDATMPALWVVAVASILGVFNQATDQSTVQRWMTTAGETGTRKAVCVSAVVGIIASFLFFAVGTALYVFFKTNPSLLEPTLKNDAVYPLYIMQQLPVGISGLIIAGVFSASMSSLDSAINAVSMSITNDFYKRLKPDASERSALKLARLLTVILGVVGTAGAAVLVYHGDAVKSIWDVYISIMGLFLGGLAGLFAVGMLTRRASGVGAIVGVVSSAGAVFAAQKLTELHFFLYGPIGIVTCFIVTYAVSVMIPGKKKSIEGLTVYSMPARRD
ncbi:MAG: sodium/solute symporter [Kiritimatiellae bacterium]|nr:sodium/solute symporter [Kiritimatiellia bacterium]